METNQSICRANYLTGFYMMVAVIVNWLDKVFRIFLEFCKEEFSSISDAVDVLLSALFNSYLSQ